MPIKPKRQCNKVGCPELTDRPSGYCESHEKQIKVNYERTRETAVKRGYDTRWRKIRRMKLNNDPICERCQGIASLVHHRDRDTSNVAFDNLESLCTQCHEKEHHKERRGGGIKS